MVLTTPKQIMEVDFHILRQEALVSLSGFFSRLAYVHQDAAGDGLGTGVHVDDWADRPVRRVSIPPADFVKP